MKVSFYTTIGQQPKLIKTETWAQMYVGLQFEHNQATYQVDSLKWINREKGILNAACIELPIYRHTTTEIPILQSSNNINSDPEPTNI